MTDHIHKRLSEEQVRMILDRYIKKQMSAEQGMNLLGLQRRQFFKWVKKFKENYDGFTIEYSRKWSNNKIDKSIDENIIEELEIEKTLIDNPSMPVHFYNYSFIKDQIEKKYKQEVSLPTIIDRAKKTVFTFQDLKRRYMTVR